MNILYINHYAGSLQHGMEFRPFYLSSKWQSWGHKVLIVASSESHVRTKEVPMSGVAFRNEVVDGVSYLWCKTSKYNGNGVARVLNIFYFLFRLLQKTPFFVRIFKPNVVIASSTYPLDIFSAWLIARLSGARLIYEVHDLWPLSPMELGGMSKWHPFIMLLQVAEDFACRFSDKVVSMLPASKEHLMSRGMSAEKFVCVPNGIDLAAWNLDRQREVVKDIKSFIDDCRVKGIFTVGYFGAHGVANSLMNFIGAAEKMPTVAFCLVGGGPEKSQLQGFVKNKGIKNVHFFDPIAKDLVPSACAYLDCLYIGLQDQPLFRFGISPNKLMDYMAAARPIICAIRAGNDPVLEAGAGVTIPPENPLALVGAIEKMRNLTEAQRLEMGKLGRKYVENQNEYGILAKRFLDSMS